MADATIEVAAEAETDEPTTRSQMEKHQGFVDWYNANYGQDLNECDAATVIAEFARLRNTYRKSQDYLSKFGPAAREAAREEREAAKEKARQEREAARVAKAEAAKAAKEAAEAAGEGEEGETKPARKRAARKAKPTPVVDETDTDEVVSDDEAFE